MRPAPAAELLLVQLFRPRIIITKMTAKMTRRRTMAMRTATIGNSLMGLLEASSVVVAANCFSAGCNSKNSNKNERKIVCAIFILCFIVKILRDFLLFWPIQQIEFHENLDMSIK